MNKYLLIFTVCFVFSGCASAPAPQNHGKSLLSFEDIAAEITVTREDIEQDPAAEAVASNAAAVLVDES